MDTFLTVAEAVHVTGKSRRTITRLANRLAQAGSDQVMREKTARGYIWRISRQCLQDELRLTASPTVTTVDPKQSSASLSVPIESPHTLEIVRQGYTGMLAMHQEVKQAYEILLREKEQRIMALAHELTQTKKGWWARLLGK